MRKMMIGALVVGSVLMVGMVPVGVRVMGETAGTMPAGGMMGGMRRGPLANFLRGMVGRVMTLRSELDLTEEQKGALRAVVVAHRGEIVAVMKPVVAKKRALHDAVMAEPTDEKGIRAAADDLGKAIGDAAVVAAKVKKEAAGILTTEQKGKVAAFREEMNKSVDEMLEKMGGEGK